MRKMFREWCPKQYINTPAPTTRSFFYEGFNREYLAQYAFLEKSFKQKLFLIKFPIN